MPDLAVWSTSTVPATYQKGPL